MQTIKIVVIDEGGFGVEGDFTERLSLGGVDFAQALGRVTGRLLAGGHCGKIAEESLFMMERVYFGDLL